MAQLDALIRQDAEVAEAQRRHLEELGGRR